MATPCAWTVSDDGRRLDLHPPGFVGFYRIAMAAAVMVGAMVLPLGLVGFFGAVAWDDFAFSLRMLMGTVGLCAIVATVWLPSRLLVRALAERGCIRSAKHGVLVELGAAVPREMAWFSPRDAVEISRPRTDELGRGGLLLTAGEKAIRVGVGHHPRDVDALAKAIESVVAAGTKGPEARPEPSAALGPTWRQSLRELGHEVLRPLRHPTPYLLVDLASIVAGPLVASTLLSFDWSDTYPVAFTVFCLGLALRRFDGTYMAGMRHYAKAGSTWGLQYLGAGVALALFGTFGLTPHLGIGPAFGTALLASVGLHGLALRRARAPGPKAPARVVDFALAATLIPLSILHEGAMFSFIEDSSRDLGPLALAMVPVTTLFAYVPIRLHAFVDEPDDRGNRTWFWLTIGWLTAQPLLALGPAIAHEL